jgi:hypothetical protein
MSSNKASRKKNTTSSSSKQKQAFLSTAEELELETALDTKGGFLHIYERN